MSNYLPFEGSEGPFRAAYNNIFFTTLCNRPYNGGCVAVICRSNANMPLERWQHDIVWGKNGVDRRVDFIEGLNANYQRVYTRHFCQHETITIPELGATPFCRHHLGLLYARGCNSSSVKSYIDGLEEGILQRREVMEVVQSVLERSKEELWRQLQIAQLVRGPPDYDGCSAEILSAIEYIDKELAITDMAIRRIEKRLARCQT